MPAEIQKRMHAFEASWPEQRQVAWAPAELRSPQLPTDELPRWQQLKHSVPPPCMQLKQQPNCSLMCNNTYTRKHCEAEASPKNRQLLAWLAPPLLRVQLLVAWLPSLAACPTHSPLPLLCLLCCLLPQYRAATR